MTFKAHRIGFGAAVLLALSSTHEVRAAEPDAAAEFKRADTNGDGKLSAEENAASAAAMFETIDVDKNGKVTPTELEAAMTAAAAATKNAGPMAPATDVIKALDTNHDRALELDEQIAGASMVFELMDANKDGFVTKSEARAGRARASK